MAGYANQHSNTQSNRVGYESDGRISGYSAGLYATWYQNDANKTGAYVDSWALYNWFDNSVSSDNRSADDYDSRGVTASVEGGYTFEAGTFSGSEETLNTWYVQPQAQDHLDGCERFRPYPGKTERALKRKATEMCKRDLG